jgi:hypothetical protein
MDHFYSSIALEKLDKTLLVKDKEKGVLRLLELIDHN